MAIETEQHNGHTGLVVWTLPSCERIMQRLTDAGYSVGIKIVKPTRKRRRKFLVLVYRRL